MHDEINSDAQEWFFYGINGPNPSQKFIFLWMAFNQLYNFHCYDMHPNCSLPPNLAADLNPRLYGSSPSSNPCLCGLKNNKKNGVAEWGRSVCVVRFLPIDDSTQILNMEEAEFFATRSAYSPQSQNVDARLCGIYDIPKSKLSPDHNPLYTLGYVHAWNEFKANRLGINISIQHLARMLYTIRCNLMHGGKQLGNANDIRVVECAVPLLEQIVKSLLQSDKSVFISEI